MSPHSLPFSLISSVVFVDRSLTSSLFLNISLFLMVLQMRLFSEFLFSVVPWQCIEIALTLHVDFWVLTYFCVCWVFRVDHVIHGEGNTVLVSSFCLTAETSSFALEGTMRAQLASCRSLQRNSQLLEIIMLWVCFCSMACWGWGNLLLFLVCLVNVFNHQKVLHFVNYFFASPEVILWFLSCLFLPGLCTDLFACF